MSTAENDLMKAKEWCVKMDWLVSGTLDNEQTVIRKSSRILTRLLCRRQY